MQAPVNGAPLIGSNWGMRHQDRWQHRQMHFMHRVPWWNGATHAEVNVRHPSSLVSNCPCQRPDRWEQGESFSILGRWEQGESFIFMAEHPPEAGSELWVLAPPSIRCAHVRHNSSVRLPCLRAEEGQSRKTDRKKMLTAYFISSQLCRPGKTRLGCATSQQSAPPLCTSGWPLWHPPSHPS